MSGDEGEHFVRYREHIAARDEIRAKVQDLELQTVRLSASLLHLPEKVDQLTNVVQNLAQQIAKQSVIQQQTPEVDHAALALHRAIEAFPQGRGGVGGFERILTLGLVAFTSFMAARFFIGGM